MEGTYNNHLVQLPDQFEAEQKLKHIIKGPECLKHWQAWGIDRLSRRFIAVFDHPVRQEVLPNVQSEPPLMRLCLSQVCSVILKEHVQSEV